ncbi:MAG: 16S rRNA (cytidine(1402)-2'-O)-methyltransferase [Patescibacteria group bacterium]
MLYIVATPIGNLKDITLRALEVLQSVDAIICEDTRRASILLNHHQIKKPLLVLNDHNETLNVQNIVARLQNEHFALVSDAGTPLISDPGYKLVRECIHQGIKVDSIPGASSILPALTLSGLPPDKFMFLGYLPEKPGHRKDLLGKLEIINSKLPTTFIIFVAPHKLIGTLHDMQDSYGNIEITLAKELTKIHQSVESKKISEWLEQLKSPKGEYILLLRLS